VHLQPANIFLCANDLLKIGDLGIAKALTHMQFARTQIGTPCYMAPEVGGCYVVMEMSM
jgi:NIMA (never in mitosis gene a)-related kinase